MYFFGGLDEGDRAPMAPLPESASAVPKKLRLMSIL